MALTPEVQTTEGGVLSVIRATSPLENVYQSVVLAAYNIPTEQMNTSVAGVTVPYSRLWGARSSQAGVMVVYSGRIDNPKLRSWDYTLDGHDNFVLRLGTGGKTLVFDLSTGQWSWWANGDDIRWRASIGMNWRSAGSIPAQYGSNVIVGDDSYGVLWVLDPEKGTDDYILEEGSTPFTRTATGQIPVSSRMAAPVYSVNLSASLGSPSLDLNTVKLEYSDDGGRTYIVADSPQVSNEGSYNQEFSWRSLGQARAPGRLFRLTDDGAFARIDTLNVNE